MPQPRFKLGLIVNPMAGLGGAIALKGSDALTSLSQAKALGATPKATERTVQALEGLTCLKSDIQIITYPAEMGEDAVIQAGFPPQLIGQIHSGATQADDTITAARALKEHGVDLLLFAGGDGTARNICEAIGTQLPVLGIPAGVKIHSGVYAVTPKAVSEVVAMLVKGDLVSLVEQEVRDIDEALFQKGQVSTRYYGALLVPQEHRYVQQVKESGVEVKELVLDDIAADFVDHMDDDTRYIMGSGRTVATVMAHLGLDNTLLGVDVIQAGELVASDCTAKELLDLTQDSTPTKIVITLIGGQGHLIGRGNQQLSPELLQRVGKENIMVLATKAKLNALNGRPLIVDSGDAQTNTMFSGLIRIHTGYEDSVLYRVADGL